MYRLEVNGKPFALHKDTMKRALRTWRMASAVGEPHLIALGMVSGDIVRRFVQMRLVVNSMVFF